MVWTNYRRIVARRTKTRANNTGYGFSATRTTRSFGFSAARRKNAAEAQHWTEAVVAADRRPTFCVVGRLSLTFTESLLAHQLTLTPHHRVGETPFPKNDTTIAGSSQLAGISQQSVRLPSIQREVDTIGRGRGRGNSGGQGGQLLIIRNTMDKSVSSLKRKHAYEIVLYCWPQ